MQPRLCFVTLGVADVARSRAFYEKLGFKPSSASTEAVCFMQANGVVLALWGRAALAEDAGVADGGGGSGGVALAHNVTTKPEVDAVMAEAVAAGASVTRAAADVFWGGYTGYFADPDGHLWEVAYNPFMPLDDKGHVTLPPP